MSPKPQLGFIGLGAMGGGMARQLATSGFNIKGYDIWAPSVQKLVDAGGHAASSPAAAAEGVDIILLMVVNSAQADSVLFDTSNSSAPPAVPALKQKAVIILCSTCPPHYALDLRKHLDEVGRTDLRLLDCPVSGGSIRAGNGTLSIFSSGLEADLDDPQVQTVLNTISNPLYRIPGGLSYGSIAKMCHQHQAAINIISASEAMALAAYAGLNTKSVYEAVNKSPVGRTWFLENRGPHMLADDFLTVHSAVSIILKDNIIVTDHARREGFPLVMENTAQQLYITGTHKGLTKEDDAGLVRLYLPKEKASLVGQLSTSTSAAAEGKAGITASTIADLLAGICLASSKECLAFAAHVGMDLNLLCDIVSKGAGQSAMFDSASKQMLAAGKMELSVVKEMKQVKANLQTALLKAQEVGCPVPMAGVAAQVLAGFGELW